MPDRKVAIHTDDSPTARGTAPKRIVIVGVAVCAVLIAGAFPRTGQASPARAAAPTLGTAASFAVLAGSTVTNTGSTIVVGNVGVSPGSAVKGFPPGSVSGGTIHRGDAIAAQAHSDATTAYNTLAGDPCNNSLTGQDLGGKTLSPGVYCFATSAQLTGPLALDGQGNPNSVFIFQIGSTLTTASSSSVSVINGAQSCNVFWQVGSSATLGTTTSFLGTILALTSITLTTRAGINGRALALNGAVTMDTNVVDVSPCAAPSTATTIPTAAPATATPGQLATATTVPATATALAATSTAIAGSTSTAVAGATNTAVAGPTSTAVAGVTATAIAGATNTAVAGSTATAIAGATSTAVAGSTSTAIAGATNTAVAVPTSTAVAAATNTAVVAATSTAIAAATNTAIAAVTSTAVSGATATPKPQKTATATPAATATSAPPTRGPGPKPSPTGTAVKPHTGDGGTYLYTSGNVVALSHTSSVRSDAPAAQIAKSSTLLPTPDGSGGGNPATPFAVLALLAAVVIVAGRLLPRILKH